MKQTPMSLREREEVIGVNISTVSREIQGNCDMRGYHRYRWRLAQKKYERRMKTRRHYLKLTDEILAEIEWKQNHRPRKSLGYRMPMEYCKQCLILSFEVCCTSN